MIIDTKEAAKRLGVSRAYVQRLLIDGRIPNAKKIGGEERGIWIIEVDDDSQPRVLPSVKERANYGVS